MNYRRPRRERSSGSSFASNRCMLDAMKRATHAVVAIAAVALFVALVTAGDAAAGGRGRGGGHHGGSHASSGAPRSGFAHHPHFFRGPLLIGAPLLYYPSPYYYYPP